ncbi:ABC-F family ATP-binding cassette domain-containing protein [Streptomyces sp. NPDC056500]|uniref:ABC-F family ATP-binding cassette domain-containing protein n=1 Tax=Streptomyces sp. NPDC056500 TaxID=3345840 RepID=UPI0036CAA7FC
MSRSPSSPSPSPSPSVVCSHLSFTWPEGTGVLADVSCALGTGRTGLVGDNGSGKSTLLRLIAGQLTPTSGTVRVAGEVGYLPQDLTLATERRVDEVLGIAGPRAALHAIEAGDTRPEQFDAIGDDWDVEERTRALLDQLGLGRIGLDRTVGQVSGGEAVLLSLAALLLARPQVLLLDEPTNNLDQAARRRLSTALAGHCGAVIVVSHDRQLLERVDQIAELRSSEVRVFTGGLSAYRSAVAIEQEAATRSVQTAEAQVAREKKELDLAQTRQARSVRYGKKMYADNRLDKTTMQAKKRSAQVAAGKERGVHEERLTAARERLDRAEALVREDAPLRLDLPATTVHPGRAVLSLRSVQLRTGAVIDTVDVHGPQRIALLGGNGAGKTTLLRTISGRLAPVGDGASNAVSVRVPMRYLPQRLDVLDDDRTIAQNVTRLAPTANDNEIRAQLARFFFRGARAEQRVGTLSGGERFRATLAALLLADPAPQLLMLDEPTNSLDLASVTQLTQALAGYRGALIVASHDRAFLQELGITRWWTLDGEGLTEGRPEEPAG